MGSLANSLAKDYLVVDDLQTCVLTSVGGVVVTLTGCDAHEFSAREPAVLQGFFQAGDRAWYLPSDQLTAAGVVPSAGCTLVDAAGLGWTITGDCAQDEALIAWECPSTRKR